MEEAKPSKKDFEIDKSLVFALNEDDVILYVDSEFSRLCEERAEDIVGQKITEYLHHYLVGNLIKQEMSFIQFMKEQKDNHIRIDIVTRRSKNRKTLSCEYRDGGFLEKTGVALLVIGHDPEKEKLLEELIEFEQESSKQIVSGSFDMVLTIDNNLKIQNVNRCFESKTKQNSYELEGRNINELLARERDQKSLSQAIEQTSALQNAYNIKLELKVADRIIPTLANIQALRDRYNNDIGYALVFRDIENELQMNSTLQQIERMQALGELAAGIAHQIKNYISGIQNGISLLEINIRSRVTVDKEAREKISTFIKEIKNRLQRLNALTRHLLDYSRNQQAPVFSYGFVNDVVLQVVELVGDAVKSKMASIDVELADDIPPLYFSPLHLEQAILNIVNNARDALPERGGQILIKTYRTKNFICIDIEDNGHGISEDIKPHIFEAFKTTKPPGKGTGLGLAVALQMVSSLGGTIEVESERESGTTFSIKIPIKKKPEIIQ
ncbi:MAG: PAS domain-containing protein [Spirochaetales bacterium]|nr:PAS domain-containing protein [Spirochaetales bacterium]